MKSFLSALLAVLLLAEPALAAITFDAVSSTGVNASSSSHSHTVAADANIAIICLAMRDDGGDVQAATGVTVGGAAATFLSGVTGATGTLMRAELWYKLTPATGSQTVAVTADATTDYMTTGVMTFKGVAQTSTFNTAATANATATTDFDIDSIASAVGEMGVLCGASRNGPISVSADATSPVSTERYDADCSFGQCLGFGYTEDGAATSINMRVDADNLSNSWAGVAVSMRALGASTRRRAIAPRIFQ